MLYVTVVLIVHFYYILACHYFTCLQLLKHVMMMDCHIPWSIWFFSAVKITHLRQFLHIHIVLCHV